tara:strand:- start:14523 stop:16409 length:1887 start_codon:yes stop_codon:yes gene_type:complete
MFNIDKLILRIVDQNSFKRRLILLNTDAILLTSSFLLSYFCVNDFILKNFSFNNLVFILFIINLISLSTYILLGKYKGITKYSNSTNLYSLVLQNLLICFLLLIIFKFLYLDYFKIKFWIVYLFTKTSFIGGASFVSRDILQKLNNDYPRKIKVAIYGASFNGAQLASIIKLDKRYKLIAFFDDTSNLWGRSIGGIPIYNSDKFLRSNKQVKKIFLSDPDGLTNEKKIELIDKFNQYSIDILRVPLFEKISDEKNIINSSRPLQIEDLLSRDCVYPDEKLINQSIKNAVICVTGAGGSIGSELCRQIIKHKPKSLIMLEMSEENLYKIQNEINNQNYQNIEIKYFLGDVTNKKFVEDIFKSFKVQMVFHAAAYKHVPIVEENPISGLHNNVISTFSVCSVALKLNLQKVILVSTDKAVRPTNIMGASKRMAELIVQSFAEISNKTHFAMVRFGNVLGSSGSVVPLFQKQISSGGPVTITHKQVVRYFMTIKEASQLVLQASALSKGGEVFLLDMGKPVKIYELAEKMIKLNGLTVNSESNPKGDIKIITTGLRPGEKLYEELLIDGKSQKTIHPLIFKANEKTNSNYDLFEEVYKLEKYLLDNNREAALKLLKKLVPDWHSKHIILEE